MSVTRLLTAEKSTLMTHQCQHNIGGCLCPFRIQRPGIPTRVRMSGWGADVRNSNWMEEVIGQGGEKNSFRGLDA